MDLHRHFTGGTSVAMFGGGVKKGFIYGKTSYEVEKRGFYATKDGIGQAATEIFA